MSDSLAALVADIDETLDVAAADVAAGLPMDADYLLRVLGYVRERLAGPRIVVVEHSLPGDVPDDLWHRAVAAALGATGGAPVPDTCRYCMGRGRGGTETTDGGPHDDCAACSGTGAAP